MKFGIVSDSSCDLSLQYARQEQVTIVSFYVSFDGEKYMKEGKERKSQLQIFIRKWQIIQTAIQRLLCRLCRIT